MDLTILAAVVAGLGSAQRLWARHHAESSNPEESPSAESLQDQAKQLQQQLQEMRRQVNFMPKESRDALQDALAVSNPEMIANPLILQMSRMRLAPKAAEESPESTLDRIQRLYYRWRMMETVLETLLWISAAGLLALGLGGMMRGSQKILQKAHNAGLALANTWLFLLFAINTLAFAASGFNPWLRMPGPFYIVPGIFLISGVLFGLALHQRIRFLPEVAMILVVPAASALPLLVFGLF